MLSGMRPTGGMHLGHYHGALKNWVRLQDEYPCLFFAADWHALTTHYENPVDRRADRLGHVHRLARRGHRPDAGDALHPVARAASTPSSRCCSMITPVGWLERVPTYKDQQQKLADRDLSTYGFLGYPLMQAADILIYRANMVPVGEDQVSHIELTREIARRFNHLYGREPGFEEKAEGRGEEDRQQEGAALQRAAHRVPGAGRRGGARGGARRCSTTRRTCRSATASGSSAISRAAAA